jgi:hypothetical protein
MPVRGVFPEGAYVLELVDARSWEFINGANGFRLEWRLAGTDATFWSFISSRAKWTWNGWLGAWEVAPWAVGRQFIFHIKQNEYNGIVRNQIGEPLVEVLPGEEG